jgi:hypothetical protein
MRPRADMHPAHVDEQLTDHSASYSLRRSTSSCRKDRVSLARGLKLSFWKRKIQVSGPGTSVSAFMRGENDMNQFRPNQRAGAQLRHALVYEQRNYTKTAGELSGQTSLTIFGGLQGAECLHRQNSSSCYYRGRYTTLWAD